MNLLPDLNSSAIWKYFEEITQIPRPSKHEERIIDYLIEFAGKHNLACKKDPIGNVLISKPASCGKENGEVFVLQSHVDMVCEKNAGVSHDFLNDPIKPYIDGEWVKATGTTLGADDGIGMAAMLAVLSDTTLIHGPLECLFTVDEETGLTGAFELQDGFFTGKTLINLDSEDEGELYIGCAGGIDTKAIFDFTYQGVEGQQKAFLVSVTGLQGGHSGDEIHKGFGNAVKIMTQLLWETYNTLGAGLNRFDGGNLKNAIPREAFATIIVDNENEQRFYSLLNQFTESKKKEFAQTDAGLSISYDEIPTPDFKLDKKFQKGMIKALMDCPNGVIAWSKDIPGLVETSTNLASIKFIDKKQVLITTSQRSSVDSAKKELAKNVAQIFSNAGAQIEHSKGYPGWTPNLNSKILSKTSETYRRLFQTEAQIKAIHAGLECGLFLEKSAELDMISIGPTIRGVHSPNERLHIPSVEKFWQLLVEIIKN
jgi:dipeptidase D